MRTIPLWGTILALWILGGIFLYNISPCCSSISSPLSILDGTNSVAKSDMNMMFGMASAVPFIPGEVKTEFTKLVTYLNDNPDRKLNLTGHFLNEEENNTDFETLGHARATTLKDSLVSMGIDPSRIGVSGILKNKKDLEVDSENNIYGGMTYGFGEMFISRSIHFEDGTAHNNSFADNLRFNASDFKLKGAVSGGLNGAFKKTADYLKSNSNRSLNIKGYYKESEKNTSLLQDLGLGRANTIKSLFLEMGVPAKQIETSSEIFEDLASEGTTIIGGATYSFFDTPATSNKLTEVEARLRKNPLVLYFSTNSDQINLSSSQRSHLADLIYYLDNKPSGAANSIGHTDNKGDEGLNANLSKNRAEFVRDYLVKNGGINATKIMTRGEGSAKPADSNETADGRAKNRRVEISIN